MSFFKKKRVKVQFDITIESVKWIFGYSKLAGKTFHAEWKKGDKEGNFGKSKSLKLEDDHDSINFDLKVRFTATINYDGDISKSPKFKSKKIAFSLVADDAKDKGEALVGKTEFDLATVANPGKFEPRQEIVLVGKDKKETNRSPRLQVAIKAEWIKLDGKKIVASSDGDSKDPKKKKSKDDDILGELGDIAADEVSAFKKKKESKKDKNKNPELALLEGSEGGGKKTIEINGVEHDLVDTDELSEIEEDWDGEKTDRDYLTDSDELGEDPFEEEERKEREEAAKTESKASRRASIANISTLEGSEGGDKKKHKDKKKLEDSLESSGSEPKSSRKAKEAAKKKEEEEAAAKKKKEEEEAEAAAAAAKKKKEDEEAAAKKKKEEEEAAAAKKKKDEEDAKTKKKLEEEKKKEEERLKREEDRKKKKEEEEAGRKKEEEEAKKKAEEKKKLEDEAKVKKEADEKKKKELDAAEEKKRKEAEDKKKKDDETAAKKKKDEDDAAAKKKKEEEEAAAKKKKDEETAAKKKKEEEEAVAKKKKEEEASAKKKKEEEAKKKKEEEEAAAKTAEEPKSTSPSPSETAKRSSIAERTAKWNTMITNPGGKPKEATATKVEEKPESDTKKTPSPPVESETKLAHPTADRAKPPPGRRPSMKRISRGNSEAEEAAGSSSDEDDTAVKKADPVVAPKSDDRQSSVAHEELAQVKADLIKAQEEASKLRKQLKESQDQFDEALDEKSGEVADLKKKVQDLEDEIADLQDQLDEARSASGQPTADEASLREIKKLKDTVSSLEDKLKKAGQEVDSLKKELSAAKANARKKPVDEDDEDDGDTEQTQGILKNTSSASEEQLSKMKAQLKLVQQQLDNRAKVVEFLHSARWSYDSPDSLTASSKKPPSNSPAFRPSRPAFQLAEYLLQQNAFDVEHQTNAANQQVLKEILLGIQSQYLKSSDQADIGGQIGWLSYSASLLWALMRPGTVDEKIIGTEPEDDEEEEEDSSSSSESHESEGNGSEEEEEDENEEEEDDEDESGSGSEDSNDSETKGRKLQKIKKPKKAEKPPKPLKPRVPQHTLFWTHYLQERGIHCGYDDVKECLKDLAHLDVEEELAVDEEDGPARRFLDVLDMLISHQYALLIDVIQKKIGAEKLVDVFFDQSAVLQAPSAPRKREPTQQRHQHSPTLITGQLDFVMQLFRKTHSFCKALEIQLCRAATAYSMKVALSHVEQWAASILSGSNLNQPLLTWVNERLEPLREAANVLLIDKHVFEEDVRSVFTALSIVQINRLLSQFAPDEFAPDKVPEDALRTVQKAANSITDPKKKVVNVIATQITLLPKFV